MLALVFSLAEGMSFLWPGEGRSYAIVLFHRLAADLVHSHAADAAKRLVKRSRTVYVSDMRVGPVFDGRLKKEVASPAAQLSSLWLGRTSVPSSSEWRTTTVRIVSKP